MCLRLAPCVLGQPEVVAVKVQRLCCISHELETIVLPQIAKTFYADELRSTHLWRQRILARECAMHPQELRACPPSQLLLRSMLRGLDAQFSAPVHGKPQGLPTRAAPDLKCEAANFQCLAHGRVRYSWFSLAKATRRCARSRSFPAGHIPALSRSRTRERVSNSRIALFFQKPTLRTSWRIRSTMSRVAASAAVRWVSFNSRPLLHSSR